MHPLVAVQEAQDLPPAPEWHGLGCPCKPDPVATFASRSKDDWLLERAKRHRHLQHDAPLLEFAASGQMRTRAIAQGFDDDLIVARARESTQDASRIGVGEAGQLAADDHPPESSYPKVIESIVWES